ncbi:hypothetical protein PBY51_015187 [Eleginops maclovinus]|uniref:Uncharacterized protein n=1 Tax=Eleginops maclovinus TaxID=56733 RepID=A0AAN7X687_ELEMC|nr:hypothetical protein PBY51_015187 [Eleginops maclovinus]
MLKEGEAGTEAHLRCSRLRQSYFQTASPSRLLHLHLWWGNHTIAQAPVTDMTQEWIHYSQSLLGDWHTRVGCGTNAHFYFT